LAVASDAVFIVLQPGSVVANFAAIFPNITAPRVCLAITTQVGLIAAPLFPVATDPAYIVLQPGSVVANFAPIFPNVAATRVALAVPAQVGLVAAQLFSVATNSPFIVAQPCSVVPYFSPVFAKVAVTGVGRVRLIGPASLVKAVKAVRQFRPVDAVATPIADDLAEAAAERTVRGSCRSCREFADVLKDLWDIPSRRQRASRSGRVIASNHTAEDQGRH